MKFIKKAAEMAGIEIRIEKCEDGNLVINSVGDYEEGTLRHSALVRFARELGFEIESGYHDPSPPWECDGPLRFVWDAETEKGFYSVRAWLSQINIGGCHSEDRLRLQGAHEYSDWACPVCKQTICWNCAVRCVNDGTGEGPIICPHCGADGGYYE